MQKTDSIFVFLKKPTKLRELIKSQIIHSNEQSTYGKKHNIRKITFISVIANSLVFVKSSQ